jgi:hypothetical protein
MKDDKKHRFLYEYVVCCDGIELVRTTNIDIAYAQYNECIEKGHAVFDDMFAPSLIKEKLGKY